MPHQMWIKETLKAKGFKLKDMAEALGIPAPRVTDILRGKRDVQADELQALAGLLDINLASLLASLKAGGQQTVEEPSKTQLQLAGHLMGDGTILPLDKTDGIRAVAPPADASSSKGLAAYLMGDNSMAQEIKQGDIIICADPREHFYPMVPGAILLIACGKGKRALRQLVKADSGESWLVPLPEIPNPDFASWRFDMLPTSLSDAGNAPEAGTEIPPGGTVNTQHIAGAVLWVHRRFQPAADV